MTHVNVKPLERTRVYETGGQAIQHIFLFNPKWDFGGKPFGHTIEDRRKLNAALKAKDYTAFSAVQRKGYWRIELV